MLCSMFPYDYIIQYMSEFKTYCVIRYTAHLVNIKNKWQKRVSEHKVKITKFNVASGLLTLLLTYIF